MNNVIKFQPDRVEIWSGKEKETLRLVWMLDVWTSGAISSDGPFYSHSDATSRAKEFNIGVIDHG